MTGLAGDIAFALRTWRKTPAATAAAILAIALGMAANTTTFSFVSAVLIQPLPYPDPDRVVIVWQDFTAVGGPEREWTAPGLFVDWQRRSTDSLAAIAVIRGWAPVLMEGDEPERLQGAAVSASYFDVLGVPAARGRTLNAADDVAGVSTNVVISHGLWTRRFGQDPAIVGRVLRLEQESATIVGVMPAGFEPAILPADIWSATRIPAGAPTGLVTLRALARLRDGVSLALAQERVSAMARQLEGEGVSERGAGITLQPLEEEVTGPVRLPLLVLMGAVGIVLLIACMNVAILLLARAASRLREIAVRTAIGATRRRIIRQLLTEILLLVVSGSVLGLLLTQAVLDSARLLAPPGVPRLDQVQIDGTVLGFAVVLTAATGLVCGLIPTLIGARTDLMVLLRETADSRRVGRVHQLLIISEVALAVALLAAAGQITRSFDRLQRVDLGFTPQNVIAANITPPRTRYANDDAVRALFERLISRVESSNEVRQAGLASVLPLSGSDTDFTFTIEGRPLPTSRADEPIAWYRIVSEGYFGAMGIRVETGRPFLPSDDRESPCVVMVNRTLAARHWPDVSAIGAVVGLGAQQCEIVGITADVRHRGPGTPAQPEMYLSYRQRAPRGGAALVVRTSDVQAGAAALRTIIRSEDAALVPGPVRALEEMLGRTLAQPRFMSVVVSVLSGLAFLLAILGVHGLLSFGVARRAREIGVRIAVGAAHRDVIMLVVRQAALTIGAGAALGLLAALATSRFMTGLLFEIRPGDPLTLAAVATAVCAAGALATILPVRRALLVDPVNALRME